MRGTRATSGWSRLMSGWPEKGRRREQFHGRPWRRRVVAARQGVAGVARTHDQGGARVRRGAEQGGARAARGER